MVAFQEADELNPEPYDDHDRPGRDIDTPLMISMPAYNLPITPAEQSPSEGESTRAFPPDTQLGANQTVVVSTPMELPPPVMEISSESAPSSLDQLVVLEDVDDFEGAASPAGSDSCAEPTEESLLQEEGWFPLLLEKQENIHPDLDTLPILPDQMIEEGNPILQDNSQLPETGSVATLETPLLRETLREEITPIPSVQPNPNPQDQFVFGNPSSAPAIEIELPHPVANDSDVVACALVEALPVDKPQPVDEGTCLHEPDSLYLSEERSIAQEIEISELKKIVEMNPHNAMAWDALGSHFKNNGQYQESIDAYEHAISIETNNASFYYHLGLVYAAVNKNEDALRLYKKVIELDPDYGLAHATLSGCYRRMGLDELARQHITKALNNTFRDENEYNRACLESICGNSDRALEYLEQALQKQQSYTDWALHDPDLDFVRNDPRFLTLVSRYATITKIEDEQTYRKMQIDFTNTSAFVSIKQRE